MNKKFISALAVGALVLAGCGDDDDGGGGADLSDAQQGVVDQALLLVEEAGQEIDESCVEDLAGQLTEEDAQAIVDAGSDGNPELSSEGEALQLELFTCMDQEAIVGLFIQSIEEAGQEVDDDCVQDALADTDLIPLLDSEEPPAELIEAVLGCVEL